MLDKALTLFTNALGDSILGGQQQKRQKELMDYQQKLQLDMWNKTSYPAQVAKMKEAGLNPALMYGSAGSGGTTGNISQGGANGGYNDNTPDSFMAMFQMAMQKELNESVIRKNNADADLADAETAKKTGVDTQNTIAQTAVLKAEADIKKAQAEIQNKTIDQQINIIGSTMQKIAIDVRMSNSQLWEQENSAANRVKQGYADMLGSFIENRLKEQNITESKERVNKMAADILQGWSKLSIEEKRIMYEGMNWETNQFKAETARQKQIWEQFIRDTPDSQKIGAELLGDVLKILIIGMKKGGK